MVEQVDAINGIAKNKKVATKMGLAVLVAVVLAVGYFIDRRPVRGSQYTRAKNHETTTTKQGAT